MTQSNTLKVLGLAASNPKKFASDWRRTQRELADANRSLAEANRRLADANRSLAGANRTIDEITKERESLILESYVKEPPAHENAFRLFAGEWSSDVPGYGGGHAQLFDDHRIKWIAEQCGGFQGKHVLELGPLEGGHTSMVAKAGAASITAIEANSRAFVKCLIVQNALGFEAKFMLGDFTSYLENCPTKYDLIIASGILYHMENPVALVQNATKIACAIGIWTHYYDSEVVNGRDDLQKKFEKIPRFEKVGACQVELYKQSYLDALQWKGFCGGSAPTSYWMTKESLLGLFGELGFSVVVGADNKFHRNGPAMTLFARKAEQESPKRE